MHAAGSSETHNAGTQYPTALDKILGAKRSLEAHQDGVENHNDTTFSWTCLLLNCQRFSNLPLLFAVVLSNMHKKLVPLRHLGKDGPLVSALGFGCMNLSFGYGRRETDEEAFTLLDRAVQLGSTLLDTSDIYADNEDLLRLWFERSGKRDQVFLCTKFGVSKDGIRSDAAYVKEACSRSLQRLGVDQIDLYYCHRVDKKTPIEETVKAMVELKEEGKIRYLGLSEVSAATLRRACAVHPIAAVQMEYSAFALDIERPGTGFLKTCRELGVTVVAYSPLGRGILTGQLLSPDDFPEGDFRKTAPRFSKENFNKNLELVDKLKDIAKQKKCTPGQLALAWLLAQGEDIIAIPGTKRLKYLEENIGSTYVSLTSEESQLLRDEIQKVEVFGDRFAGNLQSYTFADTPSLSEAEQRK